MTLTSASVWTHRAVRAATALLTALVLQASAAAGEADPDFKAYEDASRAWFESARFVGTVPREQKLDALAAMEKAAFAEQAAALAFLENHPADPRRWTIVYKLQAFRPRYVKDWGPLDEDGKPSALVIDNLAAQGWAERVAGLKKQMMSANDFPEDLLREWRARVDQADQAKSASQQFEAKWGESPPAPDFTAIDSQGREIRLSEYRGKVVVLDFWATWCGPCLAAMPHNEEVAARYRDQGVVVLCVCTMDARGKFDPWVKANAAKYPHLVWAFDPTGKPGISLELYQASALPTQFIIDRAGNVAAYTVGYVHGESILEAKLAIAGVEVDASLRQKGEAEFESRRVKNQTRERPIEDLRQLLQRASAKTP